MLQEHGFFDSHNINAAINHLKDNPGIVLDIGANIGTFCCEIASRFPNYTIHAFEPVSLTFSELEKNIELNDFKNIVPHNIGISNKVGVVEGQTAHSEGPFGCITLSEQVEKLRSDNVIHNKTSYKVATLDSFNFEDVSLIKIDVEGMEYEVFLGAVDTIKKCRPVIIFEAWNRDWFAEKRKELLEFVEGLGYKITPMGDDNIATPEEFNIG
jgi:FkbM family methyltransferase